MELIEIVEARVNDSLTVSGRVSESGFKIRDPIKQIPNKIP